jgi:NAD(P)-dependent dehydrogenase (short-subunit alcohol dehydrogenase family)
LLDGMRVVITGAGSGIGLESALVCAREGARVAILDVDRAAVERTAADVVAAGGDALAVPADVTNEAEVEAAVSAAVSAWNGLDVVIASAGIQLAGQDDRADRLALEVWQRTIDVNLTGMFLISKHGIRALLQGEGGSVVLVCSPTGLFGCARLRRLFREQGGGLRARPRNGGRLRGGWNPRERSRSRIHPHADDRLGDARRARGAARDHSPSAPWST